MEIELSPPEIRATDTLGVDLAGLVASERDLSLDPGAGESCYNVSPMSAKYPRIPHVPWSPGDRAEDRRLDRVDPLIGVPIVITEKMDGSNLCMTSEGVFARTHVRPAAHPSFDLAKRMWAELRGQLSEDLSLFGEWMYAKHSIAYSALPGYFLVFGVRDDLAGAWCSWDETVQRAHHLELPTVPVLWQGIAKDEKDLRRLVDRSAVQPSCYGGEREGVVVRIAEPITDFGVSVTKWVRAGHIQTDDDWSSQAIIRNGLRMRG